MTAPSDRIARPALHRAQGQRRLDALDARQARDARAVDALIIRGIGGDNPQKIVELATHEMAFEDFRHALDRLLELLEGLLGLGRERDLDEELVGESQCFAVHRGGVADDDARLFQELDPPVAGGRRKPGLRGEFGHGLLPVTLQLCQDDLVRLVQIQRISCEVSSISSNEIPMLHCSRLLFGKFIRAVPGYVPHHLRED